MYFEYVGSFWLSDDEMTQMIYLVDVLGYTLSDALNEITVGWEEERFYLVGLVEDQIYEEVQKIISRSHTTK